MPAHTSFVAILFGEPEAAIFADAIERDAVRLVSTAAVLEAAIVVESEPGDPGARELDLLLHQARIHDRAVLARAPGRRPPCLARPSVRAGMPPP
jgi:uncharacterized protein with PIN domain